MYSYSGILRGSTKFLPVKFVFSPTTLTSPSTVQDPLTGLKVSTIVVEEIIHCPMHQAPLGLVVPGGHLNSTPPLMY